jgi:hypothetical protein
MFKFLIVILLSTLSNIAFAQTSYISKTQTLAEGGSEIGVDTSLFVPTIHADTRGDLIQFEEGESYLRADMELSGKYGFTNNFQVNMGLRARLNQSNQTFESEELSLVTSGLESGFIQFLYSFPMTEGLQYSFEVNYRTAFYTNSEYDPTVRPDSIVLGDGDTDVSIGGGFTFYTDSKNFFSTRALYRNPSAQLSSEFFIESEFALVWQYFAMLIGVENVTSLNGDAYTTDPEEKPQISTGSTYDYNSINRSWTAPYMGMNFALGSKWRLELKAKSKLYGVSTDLGNEVMISLHKRNSDSKSFVQKDAAFKQYSIEGVVKKLSKKRTAAVLDIGMQAGLEKGMKIDFYHFDYLGGNQLIASGFVVKVSLKKSIVKITKRFSKLRVEEGTVARSGLLR